SRRWKYFLLLNYPNTQDRIHYQRLQRTGLVATANGVARSEGGSIGIHGTDRRLLNEWKFDWTAGCISVDNRAIAELYRLLPVDCNSQALSCTGGQLTHGNAHARNDRHRRPGISMC